ncbi:hypothetical protein ACIHFE_15750 [Streptomyces sp. NPDC052396]|uniref:hypothetical protein n=1 Tax=Streptomyces sp. NPDC052396 TaxID=3365689 RepID=UPI0037D328FA
MSAQPVHSHDPRDQAPGSHNRVPRNADGIAAALQGARRMEFYRQLGMAAPEEAEAVLKRWWCEAMLDSDPAGDRLTQEALNGTLSTTTVEEVIALRKARGLPVE